MLVASLVLLATNPRMFYLHSPKDLWIPACKHRGKTGESLGADLVCLGGATYIQFLCGNL